MAANRKLAYYIESRLLRNGATEKNYICIKCNERMVRDAKPVVRGGIVWMVTGLFCSQCGVIVEDGPGEIMGPAQRRDQA